MSTRIVIASDHPLSRTGLRHVLKSASDLEIVAEANAPGPVARRPLLLWSAPASMHHRVEQMRPSP